MKQTLQTMFVESWFACTQDIKEFARSDPILGFQSSSQVARNGTENSIKANGSVVYKLPG